VLIELITKITITFKMKWNLSNGLVSTTSECSPSTLTFKGPRPSLITTLQYSPVPFYLELLNVENYMKHHHWRLRIEKAWTLILLLFRTRPFPGNNIKYRNLTEIRHVLHLQRWSILLSRSGRVQHGRQSHRSV
jgi:hypothetical protein